MVPYIVIITWIKTPTRCTLFFYFFFFIFNLIHCFFRLRTISAILFPLHVSGLTGPSSGGLNCTCSLWYSPPLQCIKLEIKKNKLYWDARSTKYLDILCFKIIKILFTLFRFTFFGHHCAHHRDQRLHVQLRSSWWWTQWCPKHVERNNVNKILRILKQSTSSWRFYSSFYSRL